MVLVSVLGVVALLFVPDRIGRIVEIIVVMFVHAQDFIVGIKDRPNLSAVVTVVIAVLVVQLQIGLEGNGLAVAKTGVHIEVLLRILVVLHLMIDTVASVLCLYLVVVGKAVVGTFPVTVPIPAA